MQSAATHISVQPEPEQVAVHRHSHSEIASKNAKWMHSQCGTMATALMLVCWNCFKKYQKNELKTTAPSKQRPSSSGVYCCTRCGMQFKMKHEKTTCDANRHKDLEESGFEVPERLRDTLAPATLPRCSFGHGSSTRRRVCRHYRLGDWVLQWIWAWEDLFISLETLQSLYCLERDKNTIVHPCERPDFTALTEKKGALEGLSSPDSSSPTTTWEAGLLWVKSSRTLGHSEKECSMKCGTCPMLSSGVAPSTQ